jgi:hypothetical protein
VLEIDCSSVGEGAADGAIPTRAFVGAKPDLGQFQGAVQGSGSFDAVEKHGVAATVSSRETPQDSLCPGQTGLVKYGGTH